MEALCFDVKAPFASFRVPSTTRGFLTFPFPPRTSILGLIGAILGTPRNEIYLEENSLCDLNIAVIMIKIPQTSNFRTNQIQTKSLLTIYKSFKIYLPRNLSRGVRSPQSLIFLNDVHYRIFIKLEEKNKDDINELESRLRSRRYGYPPYLGRANYLASLDYVDRVELEILDDVSKLTSISSLCAIKNVKKVKSGNFTIITNVPMSYNALKTQNKGILLEPGYLANIIYFTDTIEIIPAKEVYEIIKTKINELKNKKIQFLPYKLINQ